MARNPKPFRRLAKIPMLVWIKGGYTKAMLRVRRIAWRFERATQEGKQ